MGRRKIKVIQEWRLVLKHAWSVRLIVLAGLLSGAEMALPFVRDFVAIPAGTFSALTFITVAAAFVARFVAQSKISGDGNGD